MNKKPWLRLKQCLVLLCGMSLLFANLAAYANIPMFYSASNIASVAQKPPQGQKNLSARSRPENPFLSPCRIKEKCLARLELSSGPRVYMQARYYDPKIGRFLSPDPVTFSPHSHAYFNRYWYAKGNPYRYTDPDGRNFTMGLAGLLYEAYSAVTGNGFHGDRVAGAFADGYNGEGDGVVAAAVQDISTITAAVSGVGAFRAIATKGAAEATSTIAANAAKGKAGEAITRAKLGKNIAGEQVSFKTSDGTRARPDFVTKGKDVVETKTGNARLSPGQAKLKADIDAGRSVTPVGKNAQDAGLKPGTPTKMTSCTVDRC